MTNRVFLIEDLSGRSPWLQCALQEAGYSVVTFCVDSLFLREAEKLRPCVLVLHLVSCARDARICERIRAHAGLLSVPILCITAKADERERVIALDSGADDCIGEPVSPRELIARVQALIRRFARVRTPPIVAVGDVEIDKHATTLRVRGKVVSLTATEFRLLEYLLRHPGRVFGRAALVQHLSGNQDSVTLRSVDVYIRRLREKLGDDPDRPVYIHTRRGSGYYFQKDHQSKG